MKYILKSVILLVLSISVYGQTTSPEAILEKVKSKFAEVKDYQVGVSINVDVDFLKVPVTQATIFFKQPDKIKFKAEGFALLPKEGLNFSPLTILRGDYTSIYEKEDILYGNKVFIIKVIPLGGSSEIILSTLWIDKKDYIIRKVESTTKMSGTFTIDLSYEQPFNKYALPSSLVFAFDISRIDIPKGISGAMNEEEEPKKGKKKAKITHGTVTITYSNYIINKGIADSIFDEDKKK